MLCSVVSRFSILRKYPIFATYATNMCKAGKQTLECRVPKSTGVKFPWNIDEFFFGNFVTFREAVKIPSSSPLSCQMALFYKLLYRNKRVKYR